MSSNYQIQVLGYAVSVNLIMSTFNKRNGQLLPLHSTRSSILFAMHCKLVSEYFQTTLTLLALTRNTTLPTTKTHGTKTKRFNNPANCQTGRHTDTLDSGLNVSLL
jgi:hypothetical protein